MTADYTKCLYCKRQATTGNKLSGYRCNKHANPSFKVRQVCNVFAGSLAGRRWVHPTNLAPRGGYIPVLYVDDLEDGLYCRVRFFAAVDYSQRV